jgi:hypothetical protein
MYAFRRHSTTPRTILASSLARARPSSLAKPCGLEVHYRWRPLNFPANFPGEVDRG